MWYWRLNHRFFKFLHYRYTMSLKTHLFYKLKFTLCHNVILVTAFGIFLHWRWCLCNILKNGNWIIFQKFVDNIYQGGENKWVNKWTNDWGIRTFFCTYKLWLNWTRITFRVHGVLELYWFLYFQEVTMWYISRYENHTYCIFKGQ